MKRLFLLSLLFCTGCALRPHISVHSQPINKKYYASHYAKTPDPRAEKGEVGQRLIISWHIPYRDFRKHVWRAKATVQFGDRTENSFYKQIDAFEGDWILKWSGRPFIDKRGVISYKVELLQDGEVIDTFQHQLWCELIRLED